MNTVDFISINKADKLFLYSKFNNISSHKHITKDEFNRKMKKLYEEAPNSFKRTYDSAKRDAKI
jgi:hypothetical protein